MSAKPSYGGVEGFLCYRRFSRLDIEECGIKEANVFLNIVSSFLIIGPFLVRVGMVKDVGHETTWRMG